MAKECCKKFKIEDLEKFAKFMKLKGKGKLNKEEYCKYLQKKIIKRFSTKTRSFKEKKLKTRSPRRIEMDKYILPDLVDMVGEYMTEKLTKKDIKNIFKHKNIILDEGEEEFPIDEIEYLYHSDENYFKKRYKYNKRKKIISDINTLIDLNYPQNEIGELIVCYYTKKTESRFQEMSLDNDKKRGKITGRSNDKIYVAKIAKLIDPLNKRKSLDGTFSFILHTGNKLDIIKEGKEITIQLGDEEHIITEKQFVDYGFDDGIDNQRMEDLLLRTRIELFVEDLIMRLDDVFDPLSLKEVSKLSDFIKGLYMDYAETNKNTAILPGTYKLSDIKIKDFDLLEKLDSDIDSDSDPLSDED